MKNTEYKYDQLSWHQVLNGYAMGIFPMGEEPGTIAWYEASPRAIMRLENKDIKVSRSLKQVIKKEIFEIRIDTDFDTVINRCSERESTWINPLIKDAFIELHKRGYAHSIEAWKDGVLRGGLYGVAYKGAFFGESMFRTLSNSSKVCVVKLYEILKSNGFVLLDIQMMTPHFRSFGAEEITKRAYFGVLDSAMSVSCEFNW